MHVLGINISDCHDSGASIVIDGKLIAAAQQERFDRAKHSGADPIAAIKYCLKQANLIWKDIDCIAISWWNINFFEVLEKFKEMRLKRWDTDGLLEDFIEICLEDKEFDPFERKIRNGKTFRNPKGYSIGFLKDIILKYNIPVKFYDHNKCHAAATFFLSGFDKASVLVIDGCGEISSIGFYHADKGGLVLKDGETFKNSLGLFYQYISSDYLKLGSRSEGKTMGLAPYGKRSNLHNLLGSKVLNLNKGKWLKFHKENLNKKILGFPPRPLDKPPLSENYVNLAWSTQKLLEEAVSKILRKNLAQKENLCLGGGTFLNCMLNGKLSRSELVKELFIFPAASDEGISVGAALLCAYEMGDNVFFKMKHVCYGPEYSDYEIKKALLENNLKFEKKQNISEETAKLLVDNKIVGWFQGRMEIGPRALGNRSILSNPTNPKTHDIVNKIKGREPWRPLAISVLKEKACKYLVDIDEAPFMVKTYQVIKERQKEIPAGVHVDGSVRPQTVTRDINPRYYDLIKFFEDETGIPAIMNTSFNLAGEPIICSPQDAIQAFRQSGLDCLAIGDYLIKKDGKD